MDENSGRLHELNYQFQHKLLPDLFFKSKPGFVGMFLKDKDMLSTLCNDFFTHFEEENPYSKEDFSTEIFKLSADTYALKLVFPEPLTEPLCYYSLIIFKKDFSEYMYFCLEKGGIFSDNAPFLCRWNEEKAHLNYGTCEYNEKEFILRCCDIFFKHK